MLLSRFYSGNDACPLPAGSGAFYCSLCFCLGTFKIHVLRPLAASGQLRMVLCSQLILKEGFWCHGATASSMFYGSNCQGSA